MIRQLHDFQHGARAGISSALMKPTVENVLAGDDAVKMQRLLDALEAIDDVQEVHTTAVMVG